MLVGLIWEIEINAMDTQCTGRRIANKELLIKETTAYMNDRNEKKSKILLEFHYRRCKEKIIKILYLKNNRKN